MHVLCCTVDANSSDNEYLAYCAGYAFHVYYLSCMLCCLSHELLCIMCVVHDMHAKFVLHFLHMKDEQIFSLQAYQTWSAATTITYWRTTLTSRSMWGNFSFWSLSRVNSLLSIQISWEVCVHTIHATMAAILASAAVVIIQLTTNEESEAINYTAVGAAVSTM